MILRRALGVADDPLEDLNNVYWLHFEASLFAYFPPNTLNQGLSNFEDSARQGPVTLKRRSGSLDQQYAFAIENNGAHSKDRAFGITTIVANTAQTL